MIYLHCDMNNYYASIEENYDHSLKNIPFAVCGDVKARHGVVLSGNALSKKLGLISGMSVYSAKALIPSLKIVSPNFKTYIEYSKKSRIIYSKYSTKVIPYGLDEAWLILNTTSYQEAESISKEIQEEIKSILNLNVSIGISFNYIFSKLGSDLNKPDKLDCLKESDLETKIWKLPAYLMLFVGSKTRKKLQKESILTIGDLARCDKVYLKSLLGKVGVTLHEFANGNDSSFNPQIDKLKNISNTITLQKDLIDTLDIKTIIYVLVFALTKRLEKHNLVTSLCRLKLKYYDFEETSKQISLKVTTSNLKLIYFNLLYILDKIYFKGKRVRSISVTLSKLEEKLFIQEELLELNIDIEDVLRNLKLKFSNGLTLDDTFEEDRIITISEILGG